jgi:multiple sugar transport system substrate-binding protein
MTRPQSEAEYLAKMVPPSVLGTRMHRRTLFKGAVGAGSALLLPSALAACSSSSSGGGSGSGSGNKTVTLGSYQSDATPKKSLADVIAGYQTKSGNTVTVNTVDHNTFQENINNYLQGKPDDVFTWFAGYRMRFFSSQGLTGDISDVWPKLSGFTDGFKAAATGDDGKQYLVPSDYYPWAVFYRKSVWAQHGYTVPTTLDEFTALAKQMQKDGLVPIAFADKDGWPAMGTFDILNMRINGYQFHIDLMAGKKAWNGAEVKKVFDTWKSLLPYHQSGSLGRTWQEAAQTLQQKKAGMYLLGLFVAQQFTAAEQSDIDFFTFPAIDSTIGADSLDAPIDGYMMSAKPKNETVAKDLLVYLGSKEAENIAVKVDPGNLYPNSGTDVSGYTALQKKAAELVGSAKSIAQFLDRDTRPDFASTVMIPELQAFIKDPGQASSILDSIESQKKSIFV